MSNKELIEKCLLTNEAWELAKRQAASDVPAYGSGAAEHRSAERKGITEAILTKALPIIAEEIKRELERNPFNYFKPSWDKSTHEYDGGIELREDEWQDFWKRYLRGD